VTRPARRTVTTALAAAAAAALVAGCGASKTSRGPELTGVPLGPGMRVVADVRRCDKGTNPYCAVQLVVVGRSYDSSGTLVEAEKQHLNSLGWSVAQGDFGNERAADSSGQKLRLTYAPGNIDLEGIDLGWIQRAPVISRALSSQMFARAPAMSLMLQTGSA